jgi:SWI/SNF-related matrix-associated actin-dependent regulator 1 of chromatin subfamily A
MRKSQALKRLPLRKKDASENVSDADAPTSTADVSVSAPAPVMDATTPEPTLAKQKVKKAWYGSKPEKAKSIILVGIERGNRMLVRWPEHLEMLTEQMTEATTAIGRLLGKVEDLKGGFKKKLIPLNYYNARKVLCIIKQYHRLTDMHNNKLYRVELEEQFVTWYEEENKAKELCDDAAHLLEYEDDSIQTEFDFLKKPLYPWQSADMRFLNAITRHGKGAFICSETGTGKTYSVTAHLKSQGHKAVVVCPAGVVESWKRKVEDISDLSILCVTGKYPMDAYQYDVIVISYAMLKKRGLWPLSDIIDGQQRVLVLDEGHYTKSYKSKRTQQALNLGVYAKHTLVVTATPIKNRENELHPLLRVIRRLWTEESMDDFNKYYRTPEGREEIAERLRGFMIRRMFKDVKPDFPEGEVGQAWVKLTNRKDYRDAESNFMQWLMRQNVSMDRLASAERGKALVKLNKLRELSAHGKVEEAIQLIEKTMNAGEQCIVFCAFNDPLHRIAEAFASKTGTNFKGQRWAGSGVIVGGVSKKKRYKLIDAFMAGELGLLCIGVGAGGLGIDLPIARFAYFLDLPWSPADFEQCTGRLLRLGQTRDCQFIKLLADKSIDQRMEEIIHRKAGIFKEAIGDEEIVERVTGKDPTLMTASIVSELISSYIRDAVADAAVN